jgi:hypothetical protein
MVSYVLPNQTTHTDDRVDADPRERRETLTFDDRDESVWLGLGSRFLLIDVIPECVGGRPST